MNPTSAANLLLIAAVVVWILIRQLRVEPVKPRLLVIAPVVLGYFGLRSLGLHSLDQPVDDSLLALGVAASLGFGFWRGLTIRVWRDASGRWMRQGSWATLALWGALFAVRGGEYAAAHALGRPAATSLGALLLCLAVTFAAQNAVTVARMQPFAGSQALAGR